VTTVRTLLRGAQVRGGGGVVRGEGRRGGGQAVEVQREAGGPVHCVTTHALLTVKVTVRGLG